MEIRCKGNHKSVSLPSWECGLKFLHLEKSLFFLLVTPFVGVWIEISVKRVFTISYPSLPSWECGLKFLLVYKQCLVLPVTPFVGVWIEITLYTFIPCSKKSLPSWECGLKFAVELYYITPEGSLPSWECGLKYIICCVFTPISRVTPFVGVWIEIGEKKRTATAGANHIT